MDFIDRDLLKYIEDHSTPEDEILKKLNRETYAKVLRPRMLSGHLQGKLLEMLTRMIKPTSVLEIGTYTGYSAIAIAKALEQNSVLHTIEINPELEDFARKFFQEAGVTSKIHLYIGNALEIINKIDTHFEMVFIDADKTNYINYFEMVLPKVPKGGFIIADNVLWSGKVLEDSCHNDKDATAMKQFNEYIHNDNRVENLMLPIRDGITLARKL